MPYSAYEEQRGENHGIHSSHSSTANAASGNRFFGHPEGGLRRLQRAWLRWGAAITIGAALICVVAAALIPAYENFVGRETGIAVPWPTNR